MATLEDIGVSALFNIIGSIGFLLAFALLRIQPINDRVYFPKWYVAGKRTTPGSRGGVGGKFVNLNIWTYFTFLNWMPQALKMSESDIIDHAGLDSAVFSRIYSLGRPGWGHGHLNRKKENLENIRTCGHCGSPSSASSECIRWYFIFPAVRLGCQQHRQAFDIKHSSQFLQVLYPHITGVLVHILDLFHAL